MKTNCVRSQKILKGSENIRRFIDPDNPISYTMFKRFIREGMPADLIGCVWYAHGDNIDEWFKLRTRKDLSSAPDSVLDAAK